MVLLLEQPDVVCKNDEVTAAARRDPCIALASPRGGVRRGSRRPTEDLTSELDPTGAIRRFSDIDRRTN